MHYWLQRAKSIYRLRSKDKAKLDIAYGFAKKAYLDGHGKLYYQAALSLALICSRLANFEKEPGKRTAILEEAINYAYSSIFSDYYRNNNKYLKSELQIRKERNGNLGLLSEMCKEYLARVPEGIEISKVNQIISKLDSLKTV